MKDVDIEKEETAKVDIENVVYHLFKAYPTAKYIALNTALSLHNELTWKDHWYFIGFIEQPVYQLLDGYPEWVANESIKFSEDEWGLFFLHISSKDHMFRGVPIQTTSDDFASPRYFCWQMNEDGETMTQLISEEIDIGDGSNKEIASNLREMIEGSLINPVMKILKPKE